MGVGIPDNLDVSVEGDLLVIKIDLRRELGFSRSKKNILIATTSGNMKVPSKEGFYMGINVYRNGSRITPFFRKKASNKPRIKRRTKP